MVLFLREYGDSSVSEIWEKGISLDVWLTIIPFFDRSCLLYFFFFFWLIEKISANNGILLTDQEIESEGKLEIEIYDDFICC